MTQRFPLAWPAGWRRVASRQTAKFGQAGRDGFKTQTTIATARDRLQREIDLLGGTDAVLSTNVELRLDGQPRSDRSPPSDPGVAFYFHLSGRDIVLACDKWDRVADNIAAIAKHIEAMRGMDRWGVGNLAQAFTGYEALPAPEQWWQVLGVDRHAGMDEIRAAYRAASKTAHPNAGGSRAQWDRLLAALEAAERERRP